MATKPTKPKGPKKSITGKQRAARRLNIVKARAAKGKRSVDSKGRPRVLSNAAFKGQQTKRNNAAGKPKAGRAKAVSKSTYDKRVRKMTKGYESPGSSSKSKSGGAAKKAYKDTYKSVRKYGGSKSNARTMALQSAHKKGARWTYKKARTLAKGIGRKYGWSKSGVDQFARGFTKALRRG